MDLVENLDERGDSAAVFRGNTFPRDLFRLVELAEFVERDIDRADWILA